MVFQNIDICQVSEGDVIGNDARKTDLALFVINTETQRVFYGPEYIFHASTLGPVRMITQVIVNGCGIQQGFVCTDVVIALVKACFLHVGDFLFIHPYELVRNGFYKTVYRYGYRY